MLKLVLIFLCSLFLSVDAIASEGIPAVDTATDFILKILASGSVIAVVVEFALRLFKTDKPRSILLVIKAACGQLEKFFGACEKLLDKVIPQKLK